MLKPVLVICVTLASGSVLADEWFEEERREREEREERHRKEKREDERRKEQEAHRRELERQEQELKAKHVDAAREESRQALRSAPRMKKETKGATRMWHEGLSADHFAIIRNYVEAGFRISTIAFTPDGKGIVLVWGKNAVHARGAPKDLVDELYKVAERAVEIHSVAFTPTGGWAFIHTERSIKWSNEGIDAAFPAAAQRASDDGGKLHHLAFSRDGHLIVFGRNYREARGVPSELVVRVDNLSGGLAMLHSVSIRADGEWVASVQGAYSVHSSNLPPKLLALLNESARIDRELTLVVLHPNGGWVALAQN